MLARAYPISAAIPTISHGRTSGAPTSAPTAPRPRNRNRVSPNAANVPRTRHNGATMHATTNEFRSASRRLGSWSAGEYHLR